MSMILQVEYYLKFSDVPKTLRNSCVGEERICFRIFRELETSESGPIIIFDTFKNSLRLLIKTPLATEKNLANL